MKGILILPAILVLFIGMNTGYAQTMWHDVKPNVQQVRRTGTSTAIDEATIYYTPDFAWQAEELAYQLDLKGINVHTPLVEYLGNLRWPPTTDPGEFSILLGDWYWVGGMFRSTELPEFQSNPHKEGYYIYAQTDIRSLWIAANTQRGMNYGVTTLSRAIDGTTPEILASAVVDYPFFEERQIYFAQQFGANGGTEGNYGFGPTRDWELNLSDSLLRLAREVLLYEKGNGIIHTTGASEHYSEDNIEDDNVEYVLAELADGRDDNAAFARDTWSNLGFKWHEELGWHQIDNDLTPAVTNTAEMYRRIRVKARCNLVADGANYRLVPQANQPDVWFTHDLDHPDGYLNYDFHTFTTEFPGWNIPNGTPTQQNIGGNDYCQLIVANDNDPQLDAVHLRSNHAVMRLDPDFTEDGGPHSTSRQMMLSFRFRSDRTGVFPRIILRLNEYGGEPEDPCDLAPENCTTLKVREEWYI